MLITMMLTHQQGELPWAVSIVENIEGVGEASRGFNNKEEAQAEAIALAKAIVAESPDLGVTLKIQGENGRFMEERTYGKGHDPVGLNG
jgi:hypothetical protein